MARELSPMRDLDKDAIDFVRLVARGDNPTGAGVAIGKNDTYGANMMRRAEVVWAVRIEMQRLLATEAAPLGLSVLMKLARDETTPHAVRRQAASDLLSRSGHIPPKAENVKEDLKDKPLSDMSTDELRSLVDKLDGELSARARPIDGKPAPGSAA